MKEIKDITNQPSQHQLPSRFEAVHQSPTKGQEVFFPREIRGDTGQEDLKGVTENRAVEKSRKVETFTVLNQVAEQIYLEHGDTPPLWKQKKLIIALLCSMAIIIAIYSVIFIILRG